MQAAGVARPVQRAAGSAAARGAAGRRALAVPTRARGPSKTAIGSRTAYRGALSSGASSSAVFRSAGTAPSRRNVRVAARNGDVDIADRVISSLVYLLPLMDGIRYGRYFFMEFPSFARLLSPLEPLVSLYYGIPFGGFVLFLAVQFGVVSNLSLSRFIRYNAMQAVLLDILIIIPDLFLRIMGAPTSPAMVQLRVSAFNTVWLFVFACVAYGMSSCLVGQSPRLPLVGDAADQQVPP
ncbi:unnamed protein product [Pedinophyceae sp. YPF-701]|nr:unnamed protein product [Pedinophyceae sp. YPF-701]